MDLSLFGRVLWRFKVVVFLGFVVAVLLALLSYSKVEFRGGTPHLKPRAQEVWQADSTVLLTQHGFPAGRINGASTIGQFIGLAPLYAKLANSDAVKAPLKALSKRLDATYTSLPAADTSYGNVSGLPAIQFLGRGPSPGAALTITQRATDGFLNYLHAQQSSAGIKDSNRVDAQLLNSPGDVTLIVPRKKTLPIVVFLGVMFATIACAFVLENAQPRVSPRVVTDPVEEKSSVELGRSA